VDGADQDLEALDRGVAGPASVPVHVDDEAEEDRRGDERQADHVEVALVELRRLPAGRRAPRARLLLRRGLLGLWAASGWHGGRIPFDVRLKVPSMQTARA
jgi:hypothetical protein